MCAGSDQSYVFLVITPLTDTGSMEELTRLPILKMARPGEDISHAQSADNCRHEVVGLPALQRDRLYMVPFTAQQRQQGRRLLTGTAGTTELTADTELLFVNWRVQFT